MKTKLSALVLLLCIFTSACSTKNLSPSERDSYDKLVSQGVVTEPIHFKGPKKQVVWDIIIPGVGTTYAGGGSSWGWIIGGILLWPASMVFMPFIGRKTANNVNERRTVEYYQTGARAERVEELKAAGKLPANFKPRENIS